MRLIPAAAFAVFLALGSAGSAQAASAEPGLSLPPETEVAFVKKGGGHKMKGFKRGNAYGHYRGNRGRHLGWYKKGRAYGARRVYHRY